MLSDNDTYTLYDTIEHELHMQYYVMHAWWQPQHAEN